MGVYPQLRIGDFFKIKHGYAFKGEYFSDKGDHVLLTPGNFEEHGGLKLKGDKEKYYSASYPKDYLLKKGDIIIAMTDLTQQAPILGAPARIPENNRYLHNQRLGKVIDLDHSKLDAGYLFFLLNYPMVRGQIKGSATGATVKHTAPDRISSVIAPIPPLSIQHRIASILSAYDDLIENNTRRIAILEEMARRIYEEWFVRFRFPGHEKVKMVESELGLIPEGWSIQPFDGIASFVNGYAFKPDDWGTEGLPIIKIKELKAGIQPDTPRYSRILPEKYRILNGTLLFSWSADLDIYIWSGGEGWLNQHLFLVTAKENSIPTSFLFHALSESMPLFRSRSNGATMKHIKRSALSEVRAVLPNEEVLSTFSGMVQPMHDLVTRLTRKNTNLRTTRDLLLPKLISGELDVSNLPEPESIAA
jgi:type I restriction enzyme S subunit